MRLIWDRVILMRPKLKCSVWSMQSSPAERAICRAADSAAYALIISLDSLCILEMIGELAMMYLHAER
eukprot:scaffold649743_cov50-Prasinocladus_malaysianus.AAC.1